MVLNQLHIKFSTQVTDLFFELIVLIVGKVGDAAIAYSGRLAKQLVNTDQQIFTSLQVRKTQAIKNGVGC